MFQLFKRTRARHARPAPYATTRGTYDPSRDRSNQHMSTVVKGRAFTVHATTARNPLSRGTYTSYQVAWNGGYAAGSFASVCEQVTRRLGQPTATSLGERILALLAPTGMTVAASQVYDGAGDTWDREPITDQLSIDAWSRGL